MSGAFNNPHLQPGEGVLDNALRPQSLGDYIGQPKMIRRLNIALTAADSRHEAMPHVLFHGGPGLGKTSISQLISQFMGSKMHSTSGPSLARTADVLGVLTSLNDKDVLFIDEIHRISPTIEEYLYPAMEDFSVDFLVDKGVQAKTVRIPLPKFTLVGATTQAGSLSAPLRARFGLMCRVEYYSIEELVRITLRSSAILRMALSRTEAEEIARRARGTPRVANRFLARYRDYVTATGRTPAALQEMFDLEGVDARGIDDLDRAYMSCIRNHYKGGPVGIQAIAASMNEHRETLEEVVEPYLLFLGIIGRTPRGRKLL